MAKPHPELERACRGIGEELDRVVRLAMAQGVCNGQEWAAQYLDNVAREVPVSGETQEVLALISTKIREVVAETDMTWLGRNHPDAGPSEDDEFDAFLNRPEGPVA